MTHIEQMIQDMCPNGVEFKTLGEVCEMKRGSTITANQAEDGDIPVIAGGQKPAYFHNQSNREGKNITVAGSGAYAGYVAYWEQPIFVSDAFTVTPKEASLDIKFVYYFLTNIQDKIYHTKKGSGVPHVHPSSIADFEIPLPPLEIQKKIVECLDKFSALAAELQAELHLRRKQYEYYRTQLLTPHSDCNSATKPDDAQWEWKTLGEICENCYAGATPSTSRKDFWENGTIPWMSSGEVHQGHVTSVEKYITELGFQNSSTKWVPEDSVVIALAGQGKTRGCVALTKIRLCTNQSLCALIPKKDLILPEYLYQYLKTQYMQLRNVSAGDGTRGGLNLKMIREFPIAYPSIKEQIRIVELLDKFDKLTTSLEEGIPAEQIRQQRRYEYYRDLLLTFDRKAV